MQALSIIIAAVIAAVLAVALSAVGGGGIPGMIGVFVVLFLIGLLIMFIVEKISGKKKVYVSLSDEEAIELLNKTISAIPAISAAAVKHKNAGNFAWCNDFLSSENNISQLRTEAWRRTKTKFTDEEIKQYFRLWFYRL